MIKVQDQQITFNDFKTENTIRQALEFLASDSLSKQLVITGGIALILKLRDQYRNTFDLDLITDNTRELLARLNNFDPTIVTEEPLRIVLNNGLCVDILEAHDVQPQELYEHKNHYFRDLAVRFAFEHYNLISVVHDQRSAIELKVADDLSLFCIKAYEIIERRGANADEAAADLYDIALLCADSDKRQFICKRLQEINSPLKELVTSAIREAFLDTAVLAAASLRLSQRVKYKINASYLQVLGESILSELQSIS